MEKMNWISSWWTYVRISLAAIFITRMFIVLPSQPRERTLLPRSYASTRKVCGHDSKFSTRHILSLLL